MFAIAWQYLTGRCVATDFSDRQAAEWPPHPDRVFQALVAAWGERGEDPLERRALEWLESLDPPSLCFPDPVSVPDAVKVYVPINDIESKKAEGHADSMLGLIPSHRTRKERYFPSVVVGDGECALVWQEAPAGELEGALRQLCAQVGRIGHSSSLVRCWVESTPGTPRLIPNKARKTGPILRIPTQGRLVALVQNHKAALEKGVYQSPPDGWQINYTHAAATDMAQGLFSDSLIILRQTGGRQFTLRQTHDLCGTLRKTLIKGSESVSSRAKELVSGHAADSSKRLDRNHLAYLPLAFAGSPHADGHLLGLALALPKGITAEEEDELFRVLVASTTEDKLRLVLGAKGEMELEFEERLVPQQALRQQTWSQPARIWATVTPIVMDQMQKTRRSDPEGWAADQIASSCKRQGLPVPAAIRVSPVSFLTGVPSAHEFTTLPRKDKSGTVIAAHRHYHAVLEFDQEILGPLLLGAGRFRGYGLCKPLNGQVSC